MIETLADKFKPEQYEDEYQANIERLVEQKRKGEKVTTAPKPRKAPVIDLMQALQRSLSEQSKAKSLDREDPQRKTGYDRAIERRNCGMIFIAGSAANSYLVLVRGTL